MYAAGHILRLRHPLTILMASDWPQLLSSPATVVCVFKQRLSSISQAELSIESVQSGQIPNAQHGSCPENEL